MNRHLGGILASVLIAPFLMSLLIGLGDLVLRPEFITQETLVDIVVGRGSFLLTAFMAPLIVVAAICAIAIAHWQLYSKWISILCGALVGALCIAICALNDVLLDDPQVLIVPAILSGAFAGWIYWIIAIKGRTVSSPDTTETSISEDNITENNIIPK